MVCGEKCPLYEKGVCLHSDDLLSVNDDRCLHELTASDCVREIGFLKELIGRYNQLHYKLTGGFYEETPTHNHSKQPVIYVESVNLCI